MEPVPSPLVPGRTAQDDRDPLSEKEKGPSSEMATAAVATALGGLPPNTKLAAIQLAKKSLRRELTNSLRSIPSEVLENETHLVTSQIITSHHYLESNRISIYLSTSNSEIRTDPLIRHAFGSGKSLFVPFCPIDRPKVMKMLRLKDLAQFEALRENRWGIREPVDEVGMEEALDPGSDAGGGGLDLIIVPGLAFDIIGNRLGHGRGYYDRYIDMANDWARQRKRPPPATIALALREQILPPGHILPTTSWDRKPDYVYHPEGEIEKGAYFGG